MGIPSSLPTNPNPSPSPPLPQSPPPQTLPLPQSPPPQSPPLPPSQIPPLIPPTPLSPQTEPQNETPILDTHSPEPVPEPAPTQTKTKGKTKRAAGRPKETPVGKRKLVPSIPFDLNSPPQLSSELPKKRTVSSRKLQTKVAQTPSTSVSLTLSKDWLSADNIEEGSGYKNIEWQQTVYDPVQFWKDIAPFGGRGHSNNIVGAGDLFLLWCIKERKQNLKALDAKTKALTAELDQ
ncbi:leucine-rich repeat extensin-like protein 5 [Hevea brasiliensis]|uniref:leucine-rich repeat extensin-like protein 5 n=1 Tax=Hevea brasiliensis TaxID=3981 RepID=UPI0025EBBE7D|nr:leucine-rich repeat extensin-like protein 5 [Hevea brasiliensis]